MRCIYSKSWNENVSSLKLAKKIFYIFLKYDLGCFTNKFKRDLLPVNLEP